MSKGFVSWSAKGVNAVSARFDSFTKEMHDAMKEVIGERVELIKADAIQQTPVALKQGGNLKQSYDSGVEESKGLNSYGSTGYVENTAPYAVYVHEIPPPPNRSVPGKRQATHRAPGKWKFLEDPWREHAADFEKDVREAVKGMTK